MRLLAPTSHNPFISLLCILGSISSLLFLRIGYQLLSGFIVLFYIHFANYIAGYVFNFPIAAIFGVITYMNLSYFVTQNNKLLLLHNLVCICELFYHVRAVFKVFAFVLTDELYMQMYIGAWALFLTFTYLSGVSVTHKIMYVDLCNKVQVNYERSEDLTKEVVKVIQAKDQFVSSISLEVKNVLNSLNQSVEHLLTVLKDSAHIQVLKNVKFSGEILLNLVNNALDAARLRADNLELSFETADFEAVVRKSLIIHSQHLKQKNIFAQTLVDSNLPQKILIDSGRLLQIMINLLSNAIKSTPKDGQIYIEVSWHNGQENADTLLKSKDFRGLRSPSMSETRISSRGGGGELVLPDDDDEEEGSLNAGRVRSASSSNILEFSFEEESQRQKNLIALKRNSLQKLSASAKAGSNFIQNSEHWIIKRQKLSSSGPQKSIFYNQSSDRSRQSQQLGYLKVQVSDTGKGMDEKDLAMIFEANLKVDDASAMAVTENDLGLWICKQICNKMNGDIICSSTINYGTDFVFYVPVSHIEEEESTNSNALSRSRSFKGQKDKIRALVVDDYDFNRNLHKLLLEKEGVHVNLACDGKEALERYKERDDGYYDIILMDINMPVMNGITSARKIREWEMMNGFKTAEIVFISGDYFNENEILGEFDNAENIVFMRKPVEVKRIIKIVEKHKNRLLKSITLQNI